MLDSYEMQKSLTLQHAESWIHVPTMKEKTFDGVEIRKK